MKRRDFLKVSSLGAGASALTGCQMMESPVERLANPHVPELGFVREPARDIQVAASCDVVVVGGGPAGVSAAICAARQGSSVTLIERSNFLGGLWTGGLVLPVIAIYGLGKKNPWDDAARGICSEICDNIYAINMAITTDYQSRPLTDPEGTKYMLDKMISEAGVRVVYNAQASGVVMSGDRIDAVIFDCQSGRLAIRCKAVVDASGDGDVFTWAGDPHEDRFYHISTSYRVGNVPEGNTPVKGVHLSNVGDGVQYDGLDVFKVSELQQKHRLQIWDKVEAMKTKPGYEEAFLLEVAPQTGVRITRVLESLHNVTLDDSMEWKTYDDVIGMAGACDPVTYKGEKVMPENRPVWQIPYRSLVPKKTPNLLVCGRCFGFDKGIAWDAREIATCMVTGQAAGTAIAMSVALRCAAKDVDIKKLQDSLRKQNVRLDF